MRLRQFALCVLTVFTSLTPTKAWSALEDADQAKAASGHASLKAYSGATISLKDQKTGNLFYVESNGRHIVSFNKDGTVLWNVDAFEALPKIQFVGAAVVRDLKLDHGHLAITIAKHAYAEVELQSGNVKFLGAD